MIKEALSGEFLHEAENTRKLLNAIPDSILGYKPSEISWTAAELASHIAGLYNWYAPVFEQDIFDLATYKYDKGDISKASNIVAKFEENAAAAQKVLERLDENTLFTPWKMIRGDKEIIPAKPRIQIVRAMLYNHLYHHRGEMIVYLRATGNKVPGLYGLVYENSN